MDDLTQRITRHVMGATYEDLPSHTVKVIKKLFLDTLGTTLAGSGVDEVKTLTNMVVGWGGQKECTIAVFGGKVPAHHAALVNSAMARARDLDDVHEAGGGHLSATFVPASLVLAEHAERPVSGKEVILGIALGADLTCRIRSAITTYSGWLAETFAPFGVVAMASKFMNFDEERLNNALGIAFSTCSGSLQAATDGASTVKLQQGLGAQSGVLSTVLAENGFTGVKDIFDGTFGFIRLYGQGKYHRHLIENLGNPYEVTNDSVKPYPCCKYIHMPILGVLDLIKENHIDPNTIARINIYANTNTSKVTLTDPHLSSTVDAQFSTPYCVAVAARRGRVFIDDFTEERIRDNDVLALAEKVKVITDPELDKIPQMIAPCRVEIKTVDGRSYTRYVEYAKGHPKNPMTMDEIAEKFRQCAQFSARPFQPARIAQIIESVTNLETIGDVRQIAELMVA